MGFVATSFLVGVVFDTRGDFTSWHDSDLAGQHAMLAEREAFLTRILVASPSAGRAAHDVMDVRLALAWLEETMLDRELEAEAMHEAVYAPRWLEAIPARFHHPAIIN